MSAVPVRIERITSLAAVPLSRLLTVSVADGHRLVQRLCDDWRSGGNRFDRDGEALFVAWRGARLAGVGGLNRDPFSDARPDDARPDDARRVEVTVSVGCATTRDPADAAPDLFSRADEALYKAKGAGRNRVFSWVPAAVAARR